ncbi:MAG: hypothetical protein IKP73_04525 [Bacteroidales bacterium]|nr:hypothetical protein [Bacteroidales bacterium]
MKPIKRTYAYIGTALLITAAATAIIKTVRRPSRRILRYAKKFVGIREQGNNQGWDNADFQQRMADIGGWRFGDAWCAEFVKMVICSLAHGKALAYFQKTLHPNVVQTWTNFQTPSNFHKVITKPEKGCLIFYKSHVEFYDGEAKEGGYNIVSGNTSFPEGGQGVVAKRRISAQHDGYTLLGYVKITKL